MAKKKLTPEQESQIKTLLANNEMLEKTKKEAQERGNKTSVQQIERAQEDVLEHIKMIDPSVTPTVSKKTSLSSNKKVINQDNLFDTDMSIFDILEENEKNKQDLVESKIKEETVDIPWSEDNLTPSETTIATETTFNDVDPSIQYDVIQLPSNGQCYRNKMDRLPVAYLTAYDENIIMSPNLYKDGLVIDFLLKNKIMNKEINVDDLVSGDIDAIVLFLRATSYGPDFPIVVADPETGEQIETTVDLTTLKPKEFTLVADENGWFEYITPIKKDTIKFRYLTRKQEKQLKKVTELESLGTKAFLLNEEKETLLAALVGDEYIAENDKKVIKAATSVIERWTEKLKKVNESVNGNTDREYIRKYINNMPARDSLMLRKYINDNRPGIDFNIVVERPESLGGGSFKTFLNWDDSVFLNISDGREES